MLDDITRSLIIASNDAKQFKNQHPEYFADPISEIERSLNILKNQLIWKERYERFTAEMVYDKNMPKSYQESLSIIEQLSDAVIKGYRNAESGYQG